MDLLNVQFDKIIGSWWRSACTSRRIASQAVCRSKQTALLQYLGYHEIPFQKLFETWHFNKICTNFSKTSYFAYKKFRFREKKLKHFDFAELCEANFLQLSLKNTILFALNFLESLLRNYQFYFVYYKTRWKL